MLIEAPWFWIMIKKNFWSIFMLKCENHYFWIREYYFCGLLDYAFTC
jgi:hypothetical protein